MKLLEAVSIRINSIIDQMKNIKTRDIADSAGISRSTLWKVLHPDYTIVKTMKLNTLYQILAALDIKLGYFFNDPIFDEIED